MEKFEKIYQSSKLNEGIEKGDRIKPSNLKKNNSITIQDFHGSSVKVTIKWSDKFIESENLIDDICDCIDRYCNGFEIVN